MKRYILILAIISATAANAQILLTPSSTGTHVKWWNGYLAGNYSSTSYWWTFESGLNLIVPDV